MYSLRVSEVVRWVEGSNLASVEQFVGDTDSNLPIRNIHKLIDEPTDERFAREAMLNVTKPSTTRLKIQRSRAFLQMTGQFICTVVFNEKVGLVCVGKGNIQRW